MRINKQKFNRTFQSLIKNGWNMRVLTPDDLDSICQNENIKIMVERLHSDVITLIDLTQLGIMIDSRIKKAPRLAIGFHGLAHCLYYKNNSLIGDRLTTSCALIDHDLEKHPIENDAEDELFAHIIAACAVLPKPILESKPRERIDHEYSFCKTLKKLRYEILVKLGL